MLTRLLLSLTLLGSLSTFGLAEEADSSADNTAAAEAHAHDHEGDHGGAHAAGPAAKPDPLATDPDLAIWTLIVFGVMLAVLRAVAWGPIVEGLAKRESNISGEIAAAAAKHEEAKTMLAQHETKMEAAADDVREMLEEARRDAEVTKSTIVADAQKMAEAERQRAIRDIEQARDSAVKHLAENSANLAIDLAGKVVQSEISSGRQSEIVREALGRMASADPSNN